MTLRILVAAAALFSHAQQAAPLQAFWDHPLIVGLVHSRPTTVDMDHDLPTLSRRLIAETRDGPWASRTERELELRLQTEVVLTGNDIQHQVRCGATLCEVAIVFHASEGVEKHRKDAFGSFARLAGRGLGLDHRTSAYLNVDEEPRMQSMLAFFARRDAHRPD